MAEKKYTDFDLLLERNGDKYRVRVINSPDGPATHEFVMPFSDEKLENFILRISQGRRVTRTLRAAEEAAREFGTTLFQAVFDGAVALCLRNSITAVEQSESSLRIRLRLSATPELVDIPWEYLYDPFNRRFLALSTDTPVVRYLDLSGQIKPLAVQPPLNVLVMIASPTDVIQLDVEAEWNKLKGAVADLEQVGLLRMDRLPKATLEELQKQIRGQEYHIFHFIGHGGFDPRTNDGILMLEDEQGRGKAVSGETLGVLLHDEKTLRLALLNACEGGRTSKSDPFAGVGQSLLRQGIPAVIAMQFEVTDDTAITLTHSFYAALADGYPVDAALTEARKTIFTKNIVEWGTPVLYMRAADGHIFDVSTIDRATKTQKQVAALLDAGAVALGVKGWSKAAELFQQVLTLEPSNHRASIGLAEAQQGSTAVEATTSPQPAPLAPKRISNNLLFGVAGALALLLIIWFIATGKIGGFTNNVTPIPFVTAEEQQALNQLGAEPATEDQPSALRPATCQGIANPPLAIGVQGRICTKSETLTLRSLPRKESRGTPLASGTLFTVLAGPECGDYNGRQYQWWNVEAVGKEGWLADAQDDVDPVFLCRADVVTANFDGVWATNFATLTIRQTGNIVKAKYNQYGQTAVKEFTGSVTGNQLKAVNSSGTEINFTLATDGNHFTGSWRNRGLTLEGDWCGVRQGQALPVGCGFSGEWQTSHEVGGWVRLVQTGATVSGEFFNGATNGSIEGELGLAGRDGDASYRLYGSYKEPSSSGTFRFDLMNFNSTQFQGCWLNSNGKPGDWCGWREDTQRPAVCRPTTKTCPRFDE